MIKIVVVEFEQKKNKKKTPKNGQRAVVFGHAI